MDRNDDGSIYIGPRTLRIGYQTYPLATISRLQVLRVHWTGRGRMRQFGRPLLLILFGLALFLVLQSTGDAFAATATAVMVIALVAGVVWFAVAVHRTRERLSLVIETAGGQAAAVSSKGSGKKQNVVYELHNAIVHAIDHPEQAPGLIHFGDLVVGDKVEGNKFQGGTYSAATA